MLLLVVCVIILTTTCCAQEHVTCLRTDDRQFNLLRDLFNCSSQEDGALNNEPRDNQHQLKNQSEVISFLGSRMVYISSPYYVYQLTPGNQSWQESREYCKTWGGDLAVHGMKTLKNRKTIVRSLSTRNFYWIGANDIDSEGNWKWVNGEPANSSELNWWREEPNNHNDDEDCVFIVGNPQLPDSGLALDYSCTALYRGLCEKNNLTNSNNNES